MITNLKAMRPRIFAKLFIPLLIILSLVAPQRTQAGMLTVNTLLDENDGSCSDGDCSLRDAIQVAIAGDTITFDVTGTIVLNLGQLVVSKNLTISGPGQDNLKVDGNQYNCIFYITDGTTAFSDMTIANGSGYEGGGMYNAGISTITNVTFDNNTATDHGSALYNEHLVTLTNVIFSHNYGTSAMHNNGISTLTNVTFSDNPDRGMINYGKATLTDVTYSGNSSGYRGGGMYNITSSISSLMNVTFNGNSAEYGGGMYNDMYLTSTLTNVTFSGNTATVGGGLDTHSQTTITNVTFSGNSANTGGGMSSVIGNFNNLTMTNVTFSGNSATNYGGGLAILLETPS